LKEKRGRILPLMARIRKEFNVSVAETELRDSHQESLITCAMVNSEGGHLQKSLQGVAHWVEGNWPDGDVVATRIELW
jgi:uncharacterized protein YlxP (DUF503 family)